jgi:hypothetical protein
MILLTYLISNSHNHLQDDMLFVIFQSSRRRKKNTIERKMQISKVNETYCVLRYTIWQIEHTSKTILKYVVYNIVYFYMHVYSFLGRAWGINWLTCHRSMKYTCVIQFKLYLSTYARSQISKVDETYCVLRYNIWQIEHTSKDNS